MSLHVFFIHPTDSVTRFFNIQNPKYYSEYSIYFSEHKVMKSSKRLFG